MKKQLNIEDLKEQLTQGSEPSYDVPQGYFENLEDMIIHKAKSSGDVNDEYFQESEQKIMATVLSGHSTKDTGFYSGLRFAAAIAILILGSLTATTLLNRDVNDEPTSNQISITDPGNADEDDVLTVMARQTYYDSLDYNPYSPADYFIEDLTLADVYDFYVSADEYTTGVDSVSYSNQKSENIQDYLLEDDVAIDELLYEI
jgi:hypothetical protein